MESQTTDQQTSRLTASTAINILTIALAITCGCQRYEGPPRGSARGTVTLDGEPVAEGSISFRPTDGTKGPTAGGVITDGKYKIERLKGPVVGTHRIEIRAGKKTGRMIEASPPAPPGTMYEENAEAVPPWFNDMSELKEEIKEGKNEFNFDLSTARR